jgi:hypothetical protein
VQAGAVEQASHERSHVQGIAEMPSAVPLERTVTSAWWLARHGKAADSEQILVEDHYCSGHEVFSDLIKVGENDRCLLRGPASDEAAYEDHRWIAGS